MPQTPKLCSWPSCYSLATISSYCSPHYTRHRWLLRNQALYRENRRRRHSRLLAAWMLRPSFHHPDHSPARTPHSFTPTNRRVRQGTSPPLTPSQQLAYRRLLNTLISRRHPSTANELAQCSTIASCWIRGGGPLIKGYHNNSHPIMIASRKAGWLRKWLRTGDYDPLLLDSLLTAAKYKSTPSSRKVEDTKL